MQNNIQSILALAKREPKTLEQMALKLAEETGEVAQAILSAGNSSGSVYKKIIDGRCTGRMCRCYFGSIGVV